MGTDFTFGAMLACLRAGEGITQEQLATDIKPLLVSNGAQKLTAIRTSISQMENGRLIPREYRIAFAQYFEIPVDWFRRTWPTLEAFKVSLNEHRSGPAPERAPTLKQISSSFRGAMLTDPLPEPDDVFLVPSRRKEIEKFVTDLLDPRPRVLTVQGLSGYGKSTFVSLALKHLERSPRSRLVIAVKCTNRTTTEIIRRIEALVHDADQRFRRFNVEKVFEHVSTIVILDDADRIASADESGSTPIAIAKLTDMFSNAVRKACDLKIVVVQRPAASARPSLFGELATLSGNERGSVVSLDQLAEDDVALVLKGKLEFSSATAGQFATLLGGDPINISSFVALAIGEGKTLPVASLKLVADSIAQKVLPSDRNAELRPLLASLVKRSQTAFLTAVVMTFAPNGIDLDTCVRTVERLIQDGICPEGAASTNRDSVRAVLAEPLKNFTLTYQVKMELHSRVRMAFKTLLPEMLGILWLRLVHRRMAEVALEKLALVSGKRPTSVSFSEYYELLHHLISLYRLAPPTEPGDVEIKAKTGSAAAPSDFDLGELKHLLASPSLIIDRVAIANVTFSALILSKIDVGMGYRVLSRQFGDFEQKLKMLSMFLVDDPNDDEKELSPLPELARSYAAHLLLDIAVCASQSGLISMAHRAIRRRPSYRDQSAGSLIRAIDAMLAEGVSESDKDFVALIQDFDVDSEHLNVQATVLLREGDFQAAISTLGTYAETCLSVLDRLEQRRAVVAKPGGKARRALATLLIACRRIVSKRGQIAVLTGDRDQAEAWFDAAFRLDDLRIYPENDEPEAIEKARLKTEHNALSGETGRSYCTMLMHGGSSEDLKRAGFHIEANLKKAYSTGRRYDAVDWMILQASLERLQGDLLTAERTLKKAQELRKQPGANISFASSETLSLELERRRIRQRKRKGVPLRLSTIQELAASCKHLLLSCDAALLLAECADNDEFRTYWLRIAARVVHQGYGFRSLDLQRIEQNGPFDDLL